MSDFDDLINDLEKRKSKIDGIVHRALLKVAEERLVKPAKMLAPVDTGQLRQSIIAESDGSGVRVAATAEHAEYVEYGTGAMGDPSVPHTSKDKWRYYSERLGRWVTTSGQQPKPFFNPAVAKFESEAERVLDQEVERMLDNE